MKIISENKKQKRKIINHVKKENAGKFHVHYLQKKIFGILVENKDFSKKLHHYYKNSLKIRRKKIYGRSFISKLKRINIENEEKYRKIAEELTELKKV